MKFVYSKRHAASVDMVAWPRCWTKTTSWTRLPVLIINNFRLQPSAIVVHQLGAGRCWCLAGASANTLGTVTRKTPPWAPVREVKGSTDPLLFYTGFFLSFFIAGRGSTYFWTSALRQCNGPVRQPRERRGIGRCLRMCTWRTGKAGLVRGEQLVGYF